MNRELPDVQAGFKKGRGTRHQIANNQWIIGKAREFQKKIYISTPLTIPKPLTVWIPANWKILKEMGIPDHLTCLLRNLYAAQEVTVKTRHGTTGSKFGKTSSKLGKEHANAVYCHLAYLIYMQSTSCEMPD